MAFSGQNKQGYQIKVLLATVISNGLIDYILNN